MAEFPLFPRLHLLLSARANINPPQITTGIGPSGRTVIHLQVESEGNVRAPTSAQQTSRMTALPPTAPQSSPSGSGFGSIDSDAQETHSPVMPQPSTFGSNRINSQASSSSSTGPNQVPALSTAVARARANFSHPRKRTVEERLFDMHE